MRRARLLLCVRGGGFSWFFCSRAGTGAGRLLLSKLKLVKGKKRKFYRRFFRRGVRLRVRWQDAMGVHVHVCVGTLRPTGKSAFHEVRGRTHAPYPRLERRG